MNNNANPGLWWNSHYLNVAQCPLPARATTHYHNILLIHFEFRGKLYYVPTMKCQFESTHQPTQHTHKYTDTNLCHVCDRRPGEWCTSIVTLSKWVVPWLFIQQQEHLEVEQNHTFILPSTQFCFQSIKTTRCSLVKTFWQEFIMHYHILSPCVQGDTRNHFSLPWWMVGHF